MPPKGLISIRWPGTSQMCMGWYLKRTTQQLESTRVAAILLVIIALVLIAEIGSGWLRRRISRMR